MLRAIGSTGWLNGQPNLCVIRVLSKTWHCLSAHERLAGPPNVSSRFGRRARLARVTGPSGVGDAGSVDTSWEARRGMPAEELLGDFLLPRAPPVAKWSEDEASGVAVPVECERAAGSSSSIVASGGVIARAGVLLAAPPRAPRPAPRPRFEAAAPRPAGRGVEEESIGVVGAEAEYLGPGSEPPAEGSDGDF
jgi:hypothetical protein